MAMNRRPRDAVVLRRALGWVEVARMQAARYTRCVELYVAAFDDARTRVMLNGAASEDLENRIQLPRQPVLVPTFQLQIQSSAERYFLLDAISQIEVPNLKPGAVSRQGIVWPPFPGGMDALRALRNSEVHWHNPSDKTANAVDELWPVHAGRRDAASDADILIAETISLSQITDWLKAVEYALRDSLAQLGEPLVDLTASVVRGDDDLPWPSSRCRLHPWIAEAALGEGGAPTSQRSE